MINTFKFKNQPKTLNFTKIDLLDISHALPSGHFFENLGKTRRKCVFCHFFENPRKTLSK